MQGNCIYLILDHASIREQNKDICQLAKLLAGADIDLFQLRFGPKEKDRNIIKIAQCIKHELAQNNKPLIINNRPDIALITKAAGVHLGSGDISEVQARKLLGDNFLIGRTIHSLREFNAVNIKATNYLSLGAVFKSKTKPEVATINREELTGILRHSVKPVFAIGGITVDNLPELVKLGIENICLSDSILNSKDISKTIKELRRCLQKS